MKEIKFVQNEYIKLVRYVGVFGALFGLTITSLGSIDPKYGSPFLGLFFISIAAYLIWYSLENDFSVILKENSLNFKKNSSQNTSIEIEFSNIQKIIEKNFGAGLQITSTDGKKICVGRNIKSEGSEGANDIMYADYILLKKILAERSKKPIEAE